MQTTPLGHSGDERPHGIGAADAATLGGFFDTMPLGEAAHAVSRLDVDQQHRLFEILEPADAAHLVEQMVGVQAAEMLDDLDPGVAARILHELESDGQADLLASFEPEDAEAILAEMSPEKAAAARLLAEYPADVAGGLMSTEYLAFPVDSTVSRVIDELRHHAKTYADYTIQYIYTKDRKGRLRGVVPLRSLVLSSGQTQLAEVMIANPLSVSAETSLEDLEDLCNRHGYLAFPVTDSKGCLVGIVRRAAVQEARAERADGDYLKAFGIVGGEELRTMPLMRRSSRRLAWLTVNIMLNVVAASVIAYHQETLAAVVALAVFLPIISDMSGCSGNQAVAVSMRELALGLVKPSEVMRVFLKEMGVGLVNGTVLGILLGLLAGWWQGNIYFGLVVGAALAINTLVAVLIGGSIPLVLKRFGIDPALASGPMLTTITDLCGFFFALSFASAALPRLVG